MFLGVADSRYREESFIDWNQPNYIVYIGYNGDIYGDALKVEESDIGEGYGEGDKVQVIVNTAIGEITWKVNGEY